MFDYQCSECLTAFDELQRSHEDPPPACPECNSTGCKRLVSRTSFILKGSGWALDGYGGGKSMDDALDMIDKIKPQIGKGRS